MQQYVAIPALRNVLVQNIGLTMQKLIDQTILCHHKQRWLTGHQDSAIAGSYHNDGLASKSDTRQIENKQCSL